MAPGSLSGARWLQYSRTTSARTAASIFLQRCCRTWAACASSKPHAEAVRLLRSSQDRLCCHRGRMFACDIKPDGVGDIASKARIPGDQRVEVGGVRFFEAHEDVEVIADVLGEHERLAAAAITM